MGIYRNCCKNCQSRVLGCHGQNPDGSWKCPAWAKHQRELREEDRAMRQEQAMDIYENKNSWKRW